MNTQQLIQELTGRGVNLVAVDGRIRWTAPRGAITPDLRQALADNKPELLAILTRADAGMDPPPLLWPWDRYEWADDLAPLVQWFRHYPFPVEEEGQGEDPEPGPQLRYLLDTWEMIKAGPDSAPLAILKKRLLALHKRFVGDPVPQRGLVNRADPPAAEYERR